MDDVFAIVFQKSGVPNVPGAVIQLHRSGKWALVKGLKTHQEARAYIKKAGIHDVPRIDRNAVFLKEGVEEIDEPPPPPIFEWEDAFPAVKKPPVIEDLF